MTVEPAKEVPLQSAKSILRALSVLHEQPHSGKTGLIFMDWKRTLLAWNTMTVEPAKEEVYKERTCR
jgi:hypothetical protein